MNVNMEPANVFTNLLDNSPFGGGLQVPHAQPPKAQAFAFQGLTPQLKQEGLQQTPKMATNHAVPNVLQNMMNRSDTSKLKPSNIEASLLSLVDGELRVSSLSNLPTFLKILPRCKTEPEQTLALVVLRATSTTKDAKLAHACAGTFEKSGGLRLARAWVETAVAWQQNDLLVLLLEVLQTLPLQLTSITEARINEPIVKLRKNAREERVKRAAQDLLKFWRGKFTEKEKPTAPSATKSKKDHPSSSSSKSSSSTAASSSKATPSSTSSSSTSVPAKVKEPKALKKRSIKRLERLPFGGGNAVSKSSDLIGSLMQRKSAKDAEKKKHVSSASSSSSIGSSSSASDVKMEETPSTGSGSDSPATTTTSADDTLSMALPTIQSFKAASSATASKERKRIRWADESGEELVKVKLIESWRDLVPYDPRHDDQSFRDAKLREHASERHAMLSQHHKVPPAVAAAKSREWTTPAFIRLPEAVATRITSQANTQEMRTQNDRMRHVVEYEVLAGEVPTPSPKEWERVNEPHRGPALEVPLSDVAEVQTNNAPMPVATSAPMMAPLTNSAPRNGYPAGGYNQGTPGFDHRGYNNRNEYNGHSESDAERKLREALGPLHESTVALLLDNQDAVPQVLDEAQRYGNRIADARVHEIVEQHRRARFPPAPNAGMQQPPAYSPYGSQQQQYGDMGQYQQYPPPQQGSGGQFMPGKRKADAMGPPPQNGQLKKNRAGMHCRFFASPMGCKHGTNCRYPHVQAGPANGPELIYNGPMMGGQGAGPVNRYGPPAGMHGHHMQGGR
ncbi:hypothetical protein PHYBOEH_007136 [Phytophthora boehmeriae]|uniref:Serine/threonine-protein phosphatase 1 regulatory subunit 10 n=1 Tax=Phytophthora boehmeriae TaxID=109152 RepID=A0A8T1X6U9_9STRA|nr:hypothetical protein PHYBOEH_007136 [Phytophthora boehmeriae]